MDPGMTGMEDPYVPNPATQTLAVSATALGALASAMGRPESIMAALESINVVPDVVLKIIRPAFEHLADMAGSMRGHMEKTAHYALAPGIDRQVFKIWRDVYDAEFKKFVNIPQLGLMRFHQEKVNRFFDTMARLETTMAGFLHLVFQPLHEAYVTFEEQITQRTIQNELPEEPKGYYVIWIRILEDHYMLLLRNPEYLKMLAEALNAATAYARARRELVDDVLHYLALPGVSDFEEMHKDLYQMKKRLRKIDEAVKSRKQTLDVIPEKAGIQ